MRSRWRTLDVDIVRVWLIHPGELLPVDGDVRLSRYGILGEMLSEAGHEAVRFAPTFNHYGKTQRFDEDRTVVIDENYRIEFLRVTGYRKNVSLERLRFYRRLTRAFERRISELPEPDVILTGIPSPELTIAAIEYGHARGIPVVVDVRDLWPDIFLGVVPGALRPVARLALWRAFRRIRRIFAEADAVVAVSERYLAWGLAYGGRSASELDRVFPLGYQSSREDVAASADDGAWLREIGVDPSKLVCCYVGQFEATYDLDTVIDAARVLQERGRNEFQFVLCGDGSKTAGLRQRARGLSHVIFTGWIAPARIEAVMRVSAIGLAAYAAHAPQGLPNKPFEYMGGGLMVLSSLRGELDDVLDANRCGLPYAAGDPGSLADTLESLADDTSRIEQMRKNAHKAFEMKYSALPIYESMIGHLARVAAARDGRRYAMGRVE